MTSAGWLFLVALFLAWPTYGLSLLAWFGWVGWSGYRAGRAREKSELTTTLLEPVFQGEYADFVAHLHLPYPDHITDDEIIEGDVRTEAEMHQCGRLIMKYLAHNPKEAEAFVAALRPHYGGPNGELANPCDVIQWEFYDARDDGPLKLVAFRAVEALMTNNTLPCFQSVDLAQVTELRKGMQERQAARAARGRAA